MVGEAACWWLFCVPSLRCLAGWLHAARGAFTLAKTWRGDGQIVGGKECIALEGVAGVLRGALLSKPWAMHLRGRAGTYTQGKYQGIHPYMYGIKQY